MSIAELQKIISPKFTDRVVLEIVAKKSELSDVIVETIQIGESSTKKGDSYLGQICRLTINASEKNKTGHQEQVSIPVIAKFLPKNLARRKTYRSAVFFENEVIFYEKVWTVLQKFQDSKFVKEKFDNVPLLLSAFIDGSNDYVALLDVSPQGYEASVRSTSLDENHSAAILQVLAGFHALSLAFKDQQPELFENAASTLKETYFAEEYRSWYAPLQEKLYIVALDALEKELPPIYLEKFKKFIAKDVFGDICKGTQVRGPLSVVTHGDVWSPNFLIKYGGDKTKIENIIMIDYQLSRYTTLSVDLTFFLLTCVDIDLLQRKWDFFISLYHETLVKNLENLGSPRNLISLENLHDDLRTTMNCGVGIAIEAVIMSLLDEHEVGDLDAIQGDEAVSVETVWVFHPFKEQSKRERFAKMIKFVVDRNFI
jgi:hypothetical protein